MPLPHTQFFLNRHIVKALVCALWSPISVETRCDACLNPLNLAFLCLAVPISLYTGRNTRERGCNVFSSWLVLSVRCKCHLVCAAPPSIPKGSDTLPPPTVRWIGKEQREMGNFISSLPKTVAVLGTDVPFGYVMIAALVATFVLSGESTCVGVCRHWFSTT